MKLSLFKAKKTTYYLKLNNRNTILNLLNKKLKILSKFAVVKLKY